MTSRHLLRRLALACLCAAPVLTQAAVTYTDWQRGSVPTLIGNAVESESLVMVVITQPDWCPACIELDRDILANPASQAIADLTRDWTVFEVYGYDAEGAAFLKEQGLKFVGTPTTLLIRPGQRDRTLGEGVLVTSVVGYPENYVDQLSRGANGFDAVRAAQATAREQGTADAFEALADAYVVHGDARSAERVFRSLLARDDVGREQRADIRWALLTNVYQRVEKDHERTLAELSRFVGDYPERTSDEAVLYATAWSLLALGRADDARQILNASFLEADDADRLASYLYLVFRSPSDDLLAEAEAAARAGLGRYPEQQARLSAGLGRILRRRGCLDEAASAFEQAVRLAGPEHDNYGIYVGQLKYVRRELADGAARECRGAVAGRS